MPRRAGADNAYTRSVSANQDGHPAQAMAASGHVCLLRSLRRMGRARGLVPIVLAWYYFVAAMHGLQQGEAPKIRQVGPFVHKYECEEARQVENPALWRSEDCVSDDTEEPASYQGPRI